MNLLIVDDSKFNLVQVTDVLKEANIDCNIFTATSGEEAINIIKDNNIDIMLLDIIMPKMTGLEVLEEIRSNSKYRELIIMMLTSLTDKQYLKKSFDLGANDYISKPINEIEFTSRIKGAMRLRRHQIELYDLMYAMQEKNKKLEKTSLELKRTQSQLIISEKLSAVGQFAAGIAHEINNPLGYISSNSEILKKYCKYYNELFSKYGELTKKLVEEEGNEELKTTINNIESFKEDIGFSFITEDSFQLLEDSLEGIARIKKIIQSLMNFIQLDMKSRFKLNDFNKIVSDAVLPLEKEFRDITNIELKLGDLQEITCDSIQINQAIYHIVINAIEAIRESKSKNKGNVKIQTYLIDDFITCDIWNDGPEIKEEIINKIFDPFFTTKTVGEGTGLGLNICYDIIVNKHNGDLRVESSNDVGTRFIIRLPLDNNI